MSEILKIQLQTSAILDVPINSYSQDFTFIVNGEEFQTNKIISDLLSPKISQMHLIDPTFNSFPINTRNKGHFSYFLQLAQFSEEAIPNEELPFLSEILDNLQNDRISLKLPIRKEKITINNVIELIKTHEKNKRLYSNYLNEEIEFISKHFYDLREEQEEELKHISINTLELILSQNELQIRDENQLLNFLNKLYQNDSNYSMLYKFVHFSFVDEKSICNFVDNFDINSLDHEIWFQISNRLKLKVDIDDDNFLKQNDRYIKHQYLNLNFKEFVCKHDNKLEGIINFLTKESNNNIKSMINISSSSIYDQKYSPYNVCLLEDKDKNVRFISKDEPNSWICFDFKDHKIIPENYVIKNAGYGENSLNLKNWILECSNDQTNWIKLDEQNDCPHLNGLYLTHTFDIQTKITNPMRYIRMKQTGLNWQGNNLFEFSCIEFYGKLI